MRYRYHVDLQSSNAIRNHINQLYEDYNKTKSRIIIDLIQEWNKKYQLKLIKENE